MHITQVHDISIIHLHGEFDTIQMEKVLSLIDTFRLGGRMRILLDMTGVEHIHYTTVSHLIERTMSLRSENGDLRFTGLSPENCQIIRFSGAGHIFTSYDTVAEGILSFYGASGEENLIYH